MFNIRHVGIYTENLEKMKAFYCENFNFKEKIHNVENGTYIDTILGLNGAQIELYKLVSPCGEMLELLQYTGDLETDNNKAEQVWKKGQSHIAVTVDDIDAFYEKLCLKSVEFISKPCASPDGFAKVCFCKDPEGNFIEIVEEL